VHVIRNAGGSDSKHIPYVIGMKQMTGDQASIAFSIGFYQALGGGCSIEKSFKLGCAQIKLQNFSQEMAPILHSRTNPNSRAEFKETRKLCELLGYLVMEFRDFKDPPIRFEVHGDKLSLDESIATTLAKIVIPPDYVDIFFEDTTGEQTLIISLNPNYYYQDRSGGNLRFCYDNGSEIPVKRIQKPDK
jgi:hypothetical protein